MNSIIVELKDERQNVKAAFDSVEEHFKEEEEKDGKFLAINGFIFDLKELVKSSQELLEKAETCIKNP